jgi:hypothetical protein
MQPPRRRGAEEVAEKSGIILLVFSSDLCGLGVSAVAFAPRT